MLAALSYRIGRVDNREDSDKDRTLVLSHYSIGVHGSYYPEDEPFYNHDAASPQPLEERDL